MLDERLGLSNPDFWDDPFKSADALTADAEKDGFYGVRIAAPRLAPLDVRSHLPALVYQRATYAQLWQRSFESHGVIVAVDLDGHLAYAGKAIQHQDIVEPKLPARMLMRPDGLPAAPPRGSSAQAHAVDLCERLDVPWRPARYLVTALLGDEVSNRAETRIGPSPGVYHDPEVETFFAEERVKAGPGSVFPYPESPYPRYERTAQTPDVPLYPGIAMVGPGQQVRPHEGDRCVLHAAFRLAVLPHEIVPAHYDVPAGLARPMAVVGIALVITGARVAEPALVQMRIPVFEPPRDEGTGEPRVTGCFAVDLLQLGGTPRDPDTYYAYAFSGADMSEAVEVTLAAG